MKKEFVTYEQALDLAKLKFNEKCFGYYGIQNELNIEISSNLDTNLTRRDFYAAPTYSQAFRFFREKYKLKYCIIPLVCEQGFSDLYESRIHQEKHSISIIGNHKDYEEAELACLKKLIEIVKTYGGDEL